MIIHTCHHPAHSPIGVKGVYKKKGGFILKLFDLMKICDWNIVQLKFLWLGVKVQVLFSF